MTSRELTMARGRSAEFGFPGRNTTAIQVMHRPIRHSKPKTGPYKGYWDSGGVQWQGAFNAGEKEGLWTYTSYNGKTGIHEFYCNL